MSRQSLCVIIVSAVAFLFPVGSFAQQRIQLTPDQREKAVDLIKKHDVYKTTATTRRELCEVTATRLKGADGRETEQAIIYHFEYKDGSALRSVVDLTAGRVVEITRLELYSPKLSPEERIRALSISLAKVPAVRALYDREPDIRTEFMPFVVVQGDRVGHRLVTINYVLPRRRPPESISVTVDLTVDPDAVDPIVVQKQAAFSATSDPTETIEQMFPAGAAPAQQETGWRIKFATTTHGSGEILYIQEAHFRRSRGEAWFQVLGDCKLVEMFVPYNNGFNRYYDITNIGGALVPLDDKDFGPECLGPGKLYLGDKVARELHDGKNLWMDHWMASPKSRRVEEIHLWAVMPAGNYAYPMLYVFRSDGSIGFYAAATAHNLMNATDDSTTHLHMGCWRINVVLGEQIRNRIDSVRFESSPALGAKANTIVAPFNGGKEGGIVWKPEEMFRLRVTSNVVMNDHDPGNKVSYDLVPIRHGNGRTYGTGEEWTHKDLWVSLPTSAGGALQDRFRELPNYVMHPRDLDLQAAVIWYQSALIHRARDEDFGKIGYDRDKGVAITAWTGFELAPRNFLAKTPFYP
jgi:hypothetical protein